MALPVFQAAGTAAEGTSSCSPDWPAHQADDVGLLFVETPSTATAPAAPTGWAEVSDSPQLAAGAGGLSSTRLSIFWKRAASGAETAATIASTNHVIAQILTFRGCITTGDPWNVTAGDFDDTVDTSVSIPGDTTTVADCLIVAACASGFDTPSAQFSAWANADLASVTEQADSFTGFGNGGGFGVATGSKASAGAYGATTATLTDAFGQARISIALKPPAAGGPQNISIVAATETDTAQTLSFVKPIRKTLTAGTETDGAQALSVTHVHYRTLVPATESDTAIALSLGGVNNVTLTPAVETSTAQALVFTKPIRKTLTVASESNQAQALVVVKTIVKALTPAAETDTAQALGFIGGAPLVTATCTIADAPVTYCYAIDRPVTYATAAEDTF